MPSDIPSANTPPANDTARLFAAIELPQDVLEVLRGIQAQTQENLADAARLLRWSRPEGIHITLQFLGETPVSRIDAISEALQQASAGLTPFTLEVGGLGAFPNVRRPRVLWVGLGGDTEAATRLGAAVHDALKPLGYTPDKPFSPHMTIARVREGTRPEQLTAVSRVLSLTSTILPEPASFQVGGVSLMQSQLQSGGSVYTQVAHVPLQGAD